MKKLYYLSTLFVLACCTNFNAQESLITDYLETSSSGVKTDLDIEILKLELSNITAGDSIAILEDKFQKEIDKEKKSIEDYKLNIQENVEQNKSLDPANIDNLAKISANKSAIKLYRKGLEKAQLSLEKLQQQKTVSMEKYQRLDENETLAKKAITKFSYFNPKLNTSQEQTETFVISEDGLKVLGRIANGRLLVKKKPNVINQKENKL